MLCTSLLLTVSLAALVAAQGSSQCTSGQVVCCNKVQGASAVPNILSVTGMSSAAAADIGLVGSTCTMLTVIGLPLGKSCATNQIPVCCTDNSYNGTMSLGCSYIQPIFA